MALRMLHRSHSCMTTSVRRYVGLLVLTLVACDEGVSPAPRIHAVSFAREEVQLEVPGSASTADLLGLRVDAEAGASTAVLWTSSDTIAAMVDAQGILHSCGPASSVTITARAKGDTTKRASAKATLSASPATTAGITSITDGQSGLPADASALRGFVRFGYTVSGRWLDCSNLARVEFAVTPADGRDAVMFAQTGFPGRGTGLVGTAGWLTALQPNGRYILWLRLLIPGRAAPLPVATFPVDVRN